MIPFAYYIFMGTPSVIAGILLQSWCTYAWKALLIVLLSTGSIACVWRYTPYTQYYLNITYIRIAIIAAACFFLGAASYAYQWYTFDTFHAIAPSQWCNIRGKVEAIDSTEHLRTPCRITLSINTMQPEDGLSCALPAYSASICIYMHKVPAVRIGDTITLSHIRIKKPKDADFVRYLVKEGVYATAFASSCMPSDIVRPSWSLQRFFAEQRARLFTAIRAKTTKSAFALYSALFLGNRTFDKKQTEPLQTQFKRWGIAHVYARSGMHLGFIVLVWFFFMRCIPLPYYVKHGFVTVMCIVYALLSWSSISFLRSLAVFLLYQWCRIIKEPHNALYLTTLVCGITLVCNPLQLYFLDFQLSYALTGALAFLYHLRSDARER